MSIWRFKRSSKPNKYWYSSFNKAVSALSMVSLSKSVYSLLFGSLRRFRSICKVRWAWHLAFKRGSVSFCEAVRASLRPLMVSGRSCDKIRATESFKSIMGV